MASRHASGSADGSASKSDDDCPTTQPSREQMLEPFGFEAHLHREIVKQNRKDMIQALKERYAPKPANATWPIVLLAVLLAVVAWLLKGV